MANENFNCNLRVVSQVPRIDGRCTSYFEFRDKFMRPNLPVLITGLMHDWRASKDWVTNDGSPNLGLLSNQFGGSKVQVAECGTRDFTDQKRIDMTVAEFVAYWQRLNRGRQKGATASLLYLKDWHFVKDYPEYCSYSTPDFFRDDWLNFYLDHYRLHLVGEDNDGCCSDYRFVYMGPKGTWTPLHADVFRSYSWSGNICGKKLWHLLPPSETPLIYDSHMRNTVYDIYGEISVKEFPNFHKASWHECVQDIGQILFVPSGWYHQVTNLEDTISINHNWFNACNLHWVGQLLLADYKETKASIEDILSIADNFEELCQRNLAANSGMNLHDFSMFLVRMTCFFFSFMRQSIDQHLPWGLWKKKSGIQHSDMDFFLENVRSQVCFNLCSIAGVADIMSLEDFFKIHALSFDVAAVQRSEESERTSFDLQKVESQLDLCYNVGQDSEYSAFLAEILCQNVTCINSVMESEDTSGCPDDLTDLDCMSHHAESQRKQNQENIIPENIVNGDACFSVRRDILNRNEYTNVIKGLPHNVFDDAVFRGVNTPTQLALIIRRAIDFLNQRVPI